MRKRYERRNHLEILDQHLTSAQAADALALPESTLKTWRSEGRGPTYCKLGRRVFYAVEDLREFVEARKIAAQFPDD